MKAPRLNRDSSFAELLVYGTLLLFVYLLWTVNGLLAFAVFFVAAMVMILLIRDPA